jgi:hypothetical protein
LQDGDLAVDEINPFHFREPVAPLVAARKHLRSIPLVDVLDHIQAIAVQQLPFAGRQSKRSKSAPRHLPDRFLLVEGVGGLLVPLGQGYDVRDLVTHLASNVPKWSRKARLQIIVVSRNRLGTINHTLLTVQAIQTALNPRKKPDFTDIKVVLMDSNARDISCASNPALLARMLAPVRLISIPFLGPGLCSARAIKTNLSHLQRTLQRIV